MVITDPVPSRRRALPQVRHVQQEHPDFCNKCGDPVGLQLKYDQAGVRRARHDLLRSAQGHHPPHHLRQGCGDRQEDHPRHQGTGSLLRRHSADDARTARSSSTAPSASSSRSCTVRPASSSRRRTTRTYFLGKIIPYRGSWVEFEYDKKNMLYVRIDRKRKFLGTIFLRALGLRSDEEILKTFYTVDTHPASTTASCTGLCRTIRPRPRTCWARSCRTPSAPRAKRSRTPAARSRHHPEGDSCKAKIKQVEVETADLEGAMTAADVVDTTTGEVLIEANHELTADTPAQDDGERASPSVEVFFPERDDVGNIITNTLARTPSTSRKKR